MNEADLTRKADETGYGSSTSVTESDGGSDASLPAGPAKKRKRTPVVLPRPRKVGSLGGGIRFRMRGKCTPKKRIRGKQALCGQSTARLEPCGVACLLESLRSPAVAAVTSGDDQMHVGAASLTELPADLLRRAKAGDSHIVVHDDSGRTRDND